MSEFTAFKGLARVASVELLLILRDPMAAFFAVAFPLVLLWVKMHTADPLPGGLPIVTATVPMLSTFVIGLATLVVLPATIAQYRERRILKRLRATPASSVLLLTAQWAAHLLLAVVGTGLLIVVGVVAFDLGVPVAVGSVVLAWLLGAMSLGAIGLLLGAVLPSARGATVIGLTLFFPMVFLSGAMIPRELASPSMRSIGDLLPLAPVVQSIRAGWAGEALSMVHLGVMAAIFVVAGGLAVRLLRG